MATRAMYDATMPILRSMVAKLPPPSMVAYRREIVSSDMPYGHRVAFNRAAQFARELGVQLSVRKLGPRFFAMTRSLWRRLGGADLSEVPCWVCGSARCPQITDATATEHAPRVPLQRSTADPGVSPSQPSNAVGSGNETNTDRAEGGPDHARRE